MNKVYMCGECYFSQKLETFLNGQTKYQIINLSVGSGNLETFLNILKCNKIFEPGIFLIGGSVHDKWGWNDGETLKDILYWFQGSLYESSLVICLTGPFDRSKNETYDHRITNTLKEEFAQKHGIDVLDLRINTENVISDGIHFDTIGESIFYNKILNFLLSFKEKTINPEILRIGEIKQEIFVEKCKRLTIIHNNNDDLLDIYYNNNLIKKLTPTRLSIENPDRISFIDRPLVNNFTNIETGKIFFSQPVFIHSIIRYI